jgi:alpha,alpha-trehalose phosphorylase
MSHNSSHTSSSWLLRDNPGESNNARLAETLFSQANGFIGIRGTLEEDSRSIKNSCEGVYLNGVYSREPIIHGENAYGFASHNHKILQVPNCKSIHLQGQVNATVEAQQRTLNMATGVLSRHFTLNFAARGKVKIETQRFVCHDNSNLVCIRYQVNSLDYNGQLDIRAELDCKYGAEMDKNDPRVGHLSIERMLQLLDYQHQQDKIRLYHSVEGTDFIVASACIDKVSGDCQIGKNIDQQEAQPANLYQLHIQSGQSFELVRFALYHHDTDRTQLEAKQNTAIDALQGADFETLQSLHSKHFSAFWQSADIHIQGGNDTEQGLRFSMFHLFQSVGRNGFNSIAAKGLSGPGYDGHYFWDTEIYIVPFFALTQPEIAKQLLMYRYNTLDAARSRAKEMSHPHGALFAWRTIGGEECSAFFPAGTAQYHINSAVAFALQTYYEATGDWQFMLDFGAEVLLETARLWADIGHFNPAKNGQFCIDAVTGPDEYTAVVNNNFYTNFMASKHLKFALQVCAKMQADNPQSFSQLSSKLTLHSDELGLWQQAADKMYLPFDSRLAINPQDDDFLNKKPWDFANQPKEKTPLLLHYHPLVIYRHQVLKQADVVLAMFLGDEAFSLVQKRRNLDYYEPLTTHDSTLSSCIHSIEFAEVGELEKAYDYFVDSARMDLDNLHHNTEYGVHTACMAGAWNCITFGFLGLRIRDNGLYFKPQLPAKWTEIEQNVRYQGRLIAVKAGKQQVQFSLLQGDPMTLHCAGQAVTLGDEQMQTVKWS